MTTQKKLLHNDSQQIFKTIYVHINVICNNNYCLQNFYFQILSNLSELKNG